MTEAYSWHQFIRDILPAEAASSEGTSQKGRGVSGNIAGQKIPLAERLARAVRRATGAYESDMLKLIGRFRAAVADAAGLESPKGVRNYLAMSEALARLNETLSSKVEIREGVTFRTVTLRIELAEKYVRGEATDHGFSRAQLDQIRAALAALPSDTRKENIRVELKSSEGELVATPMSRWEAMQYRLSWNQPDVRAKMERQGFSKRTIRQIDELQPARQTLSDSCRFADPRKRKPR
jgi:hypothetical protein